MDQDALKKQVAEAALRFVPEGEVIGVGTGSTANFFIDGLASLKDRIMTLAESGPCLPMV